jgi:hypothetical protein
VQNPPVSDQRNLAKDPAVWAIVLGVIGFVIVALLADQDRYIYAGVVGVIAAAVGFFGARVLFGGGYIPEEEEKEPPPPPSA